MAPSPGIRSVPLTDGKPIEPRTVIRRGLHWDRLPTVLIGWVIFGLWWAAGGKYTIDGMPLLANMIMNFFHAPFRLAPVTDWHWYAALCWLPILISFIERRNRPRQGLVWSGTIAALVVWVVVSGLDLGSTWLAITHPGADDWLLARQVAALWPLAGGWTFLTTFAPEDGMVRLWRHLRG